MIKELKPLAQILSENDHEAGSYSYTFKEKSMPCIMEDMKDLFGKSIEVKKNKNNYLEDISGWTFAPSWFIEKDKMTSLIEGYETMLKGKDQIIKEQAETIADYEAFMVGRNKALTEKIVTIRDMESIILEQKEAIKVHEKRVEIK